MHIALECQKWLDGGNCDRLPEIAQRHTDIISKRRTIFRDSRKALDILP